MTTDEGTRLELKSLLDIIGYGAWNGGTLVDNSAFAERGLTFKGGIPVTHQTIEDRIGVRTRMAAPPDLRIGGSPCRTFWRI
jgi:hypothetical protein